MKVLLATQNPGKVKELEELLADEDIKVVSVLDFDGWQDIEESGATFAENALLKAREAVKRTGLICLADDSGLEVDALNGEPGVRSARYAGEPRDDEHNMDLLIERLTGVPDDQRSARFRCALAVVTPLGEEYLTEGTVEGKIIGQRRGKNGFGYDPVFLVQDFGRTMAELSAVQKNRLSHRAKALHKAIPILQGLKQREKQGLEDEK